MVLLFAMLAGACSLFGDDNDKADYEARNLDLLDSVPVFPGAKLLRKETHPYQLGDSSSSPIDGYTTLIVYEVPPDVTAPQVVDHYKDALEVEGWTTRLEELPIVGVGGERQGHILILGARLEAAYINVNTDGLGGIGGPGHLFTVGLDHDSYIPLTSEPPSEPPPTPSPTPGDQFGR